MVFQIYSILYQIGTLVGKSYQKMPILKLYTPKMLKCEQLYTTYLHTCAQKSYAQDKHKSL